MRHSNSKPQRRNSSPQEKDMRKSFGVIAGAAILASTGAAMAATSAPTDAKVYIISPADGAKLTGPVTVRFGLSGMGVAPAGVDHPNTGHHHLLIDADVPALDQPIPKDDRHRHYGNGQTEATLELPPGAHTQQLLLGERNHMPHAPPLKSEKITITDGPGAAGKYAASSPIRRTGSRQ